MLARLTKATRRKASRLLALVYLLCVLAPSATFAFGDGSRAAPCLTENEHGRGIVHEHVVPVVQHVRAAETEHFRDRDHSHNHALGNGPAAHEVAETGLLTALSQSDDPACDHHKSGGQCCGMMCVTALPAALAEFGRPAAPDSLCVSATYRNVADSAPPRHYRPPIFLN